MTNPGKFFHGKSAIISFGNGKTIKSPVTKVGNFSYSETWNYGFQPAATVFKANDVFSSRITVEHSRVRWIDFSKMTAEVHYKNKINYRKVDVYHDDRMVIVYASRSECYAFGEDVYGEYMKYINALMVK